MNNGWVKLHRQTFSNKLWLSEPFTKAQAWIDLFANANHTDGSFWVRGNEVKIQRGQLGWSEVTMAKRWQWCRQKVRAFLAYLEREAQIRQQKVYKITTIITILNYDKYQDLTTDLTTERQQKDNRTYTNKNVKKVKNDKNIEGEDTPSQIASNFFLKKNYYEQYLTEFSEKNPLEVVTQEFDKFIVYWTELNGSGTKQRWQMQPVFDVKRRLVTWLGKVNSFISRKQTKII